MAKIISQWTLNDPTSMTRVWDNSGNRHHGDFGENKPENQTDSPNGSRSFKWNNSHVILPEITGVKAISYWIKKEAGSTLVDDTQVDGNWHVVVVTENVESAVTKLKNAMNGGSGFSLSDVIFYGSELSEADIKAIKEVKIRVAKNQMTVKEIVQDENVSNVQFSRRGIVTVSEFENPVVGQGQPQFKHGQVIVDNIVEQ